VAFFYRWGNWPREGRVPSLSHIARH
jgi:hypothetical protein